MSERHYPTDEYENFITTHLQAFAECIPTKPRAKCRVRWESKVKWENEITREKHIYWIKKKWAETRKDSERTKTLKKNTIKMHPNSDQ